MGVDEAVSQPRRRLIRHLRWWVGELHLQVQEIAEEDGLLAVRAGTPEADHAAEAVAV
jgi:hypothetical protein